MGYQWTCSMLTSLVLNRPFAGTSFWAVLWCWGILSLQPSRHLTPKTNFGWFNARLVVVYWYLHITISRDLYIYIICSYFWWKSQKSTANLCEIGWVDPLFSTCDSVRVRIPKVSCDPAWCLERNAATRYFLGFWVAMRNSFGHFWALGDTRYTVHSLRKSYIYISIHTYLSCRISCC